MIKIINKTKSSVLAQKAELANTFFSRLKGLLGRNGLKDGEGLIITKCDSIHTFFMRFKIDVLFLDKENQVVAMANSLPPSRFFSALFKGKLALELPENSILKTNTALKDKIEFGKTHSTPGVE